MMDSKDILQKIGLAAFLAAVALSLPLVAGFFGSFHPALDTLAHFRMHLAAGLILVAIPLVLTRRFRWNGLLAVALGAWAILNVAGLSAIPGFGTVQASSETDSGAPVYRLMHINLLSNNPEPAKVLSLLGRIRPDVVTFAEVSPMWVGKMKLMESAYPYRIVCRMNGHIGDVAILSLRPMETGTDEDCTSDGSFTSAVVDFGGYRIDIAAIHLRWPWPKDQASHIESLVPRLGLLSDTAILAGDLNATPWSAASSRVAAAAGMEPAGPNNPTWLLRGLPRWLGFAGLPIDRVFTRGDVVVHSVRTLDWVGSDHLPVLMEFSFRQAEPLDEDATTATASLSPL